MGEDETIEEEGNPWEEDLEEDLEIDFEYLAV